MIPGLALTTTANRAAELAPIARAHGLRPVVLPCIEVAPARESVLEKARRSAAGSHWLLVTSARTVDLLWPDGHFPDVEVAAVGSRTAAAVARAGGAVSLMGDSDSSSLTSDLAPLVENAAVCFPHGSGADLSKVMQLEQAGGTVSTWEIYATQPVPPALDPVDAVAFGSPSAVAGWSLSRGFAGVVVGAIGETTSAAVADLGHDPHVVANQPDYEELLRRLSTKVRERITT